MEKKCEHGGREQSDRERHEFSWLIPVIRIVVNGEDMVALCFCVFKRLEMDGG